MSSCSVPRLKSPASFNHENDPKLCMVGRNRASSFQLSRHPLWLMSSCGRHWADDCLGHVGERLAAQSVAEIVKSYAKQAGLDPALFAGHSLRAGFLTS